MGNGQSVEQSEHTWHLSIKFIVLYGCSSWHPKTIAVVTSKITDHHNKYSNNNNEKVWNIVRIAKMWPETWSKQMLLEKWHWQTCLMQGCHKPSVCFKKKKKALSAKCSKMKCAYMCFLDQQLSNLPHGPLGFPRLFRMSATSDLLSW